MGQVNGKNRWWFIVRAPESCLTEVDRKWKHKYWQWQLVQTIEGVFFRGGTCVIETWVKGSGALTRRSGAGIGGTEEEGGGRKRWFDCRNGQL